MLTDNSNKNVNSDLLGTILNVINEDKNYNINELVGLLALSNLLGIITFLNSQNLNFPHQLTTSENENLDIKKLASTLLGDKKINPAMLMNLLKNFSTETNTSNKLSKENTKEENKNNKS